MNILTELLPGARQIRTPLAVGYLWLLVGWINAPLASDAFAHSQLVRRADTDIRDLTPALIVIVASFVAYMIGLVFEIVDGWLIRFSSVAIPALLALALLIYFLDFIRHRYYVVVPGIILVLSLIYLRSRRLKVSVEAILSQYADNIWLRIHYQYLPLKDLVTRVWSPASPIKDGLVSEQVARLLDGHPNVEDKFCQTISLPALRLACRIAGLGDEDSKNSSTALGRSMGDLAKAADRSFIDTDSEKLLREYLRGRIMSSAEVRRAVVHRVMIATDVRRAVDRALDDAQARIQADKPSVFEAYDRLRSDADFRKGVAAPLSVALASILLAYSANRLLVILATIPMLIIYFSGMKKQEEAAKVVAHSVSAEVTTIRLEVTDIRLLSWPTQRSSSDLRARLHSIYLTLTARKRSSSRAELLDSTITGDDGPSIVD